MHYEVLGGGPSVPSIAPVGYLEDQLASEQNPRGAMLLGLLNLGSTLPRSPAIGARPLTVSF